MKEQYVEHRDGGYWIAGTRVSLDSIVYAFWSGQTAEAIAQSFPVLTLEQVYGSIAFYLANRSKIDAYLGKAKADFETMRRASPKQTRCFIKSWPKPGAISRQRTNEGAVSG